MNQVLITLSRKNINPDYPFAVVVVEDGKHGQEASCKTLREARIYANGVCFALCCIAQDRRFQINPVVDPIFSFDA